METGIFIHGNPNRYGLVFSTVAVAWMGLIFFLSSLKGPAGDSEGSKLLELSIASWLGGLSSYFAHAFMFGALATLVQASIWSWRPGFHLRGSIVSVVFATVYGISDEYHQSFVAGRVATASDVFADCSGASVSALVAWFITRRSIYR